MTFLEEYIPEMAEMESEEFKRVAKLMQAIANRAVKLSTEADALISALTRTFLLEDGSIKGKLGMSFVLEDLKRSGLQIFFAADH